MPFSIHQIPDWSCAERLARIAKTRLVDDRQRLVRVSGRAAWSRSRPHPFPAFLNSTAIFTSKPGKMPNETWLHHSVLIDPSGAVVGLLHPVSVQPRGGATFTSHGKEASSVPASSGNTVGQAGDQRFWPRPTPRSIPVDGRALQKLQEHVAGRFSWRCR